MSKGATVISWGTAGELGTWTIVSSASVHRACSAHALSISTLTATIPVRTLHHDTKTMNGSSKRDDDRHDTRTATKIDINEAAGRSEAAELPEQDNQTIR